MDRFFKKRTDELVQIASAGWKCALCNEETLNWPDGYEIINVDGIWTGVGYCCLDMVYAYFADRWEK